MNRSWSRRSDEDASHPQSITALVVDDDPSYVRYIARLLRKLGIEVTTAFDGFQALQTLADRLFDLMLIDLNMPGLDGFELLESIRKDDRHGASYLIMITGREDVATKIEALIRGYDDYLIKSSTEIEIVAKVLASRRIVARQQTLDHAIHTYYGLSIRDELTGLFNRRYFFAEAEKLFKDPCVNLTLAIFDLDDFKQINDRFGHPTGDRVLADVGAVFSRYTRQEDFVARYGGDEFIMLICDLSLDEAEHVVRRLGSRLGELRWGAGEESFTVSFTTGIASVEYLEGASVRQLLEICDQDLYKNKYVRKHPVAGEASEPESAKESKSVILLTNRA